MRCLFIALSLAFLLAASVVSYAAAVELRLEDAETNAGQSGYLRLIANSDIPLAGLIVPIRLDPQRFVLDSVSFAHTSVPPVFACASRSTFDGEGVFVSIVPPLTLPIETFLPKDDELFRIHYTIPPQSPSGVVVVDTFMAYNGTFGYWERLHASDEFGLGLIYPSWRAGTIYVLGEENSSEEEEESAPLPSALTVEQNFPNPFNATTKVTYSLPADALIAIDVFDLLGRRVAPTQYIAASQGYSTVEIDNLDLPSGVYFYRLTSPYGSQTRKMTIVR